MVSIVENPSGTWLSAAGDQQQPLHGYPHFRFSGPMNGYFSNDNKNL